MNNCIGIINLDENEQKTTELTRHRPLASLPIAGRYRVVDFILSNMTNSGIEAIGIFTKNKSIKDSIPFAPFISLATMLIMLTENYILTSYFDIMYNVL